MNVLGDLFSLIVGMWEASFPFCGTVTHSHPAVWVYKQTECCAQRQAYGRGEEESDGSRSDVGKVESPADPPETNTRKRDVRFTGFRVLLGNMKALTHSDTVQSFTFTHIYWENVVADSTQMLLHILPSLRKQADGLHTYAQAYSNTYITYFFQNLAAIADML